jgi:hypothetical protein
MGLDPKSLWAAPAEPDYRTWVGKRVVVRVGLYSQAGVVQACVQVRSAVRLRVRLDDGTTRLVRPQRVEPTWLGRNPRAAQEPGSR